MGAGHAIRDELSGMLGRIRRSPACRPSLFCRRYRDRLASQGLGAVMAARARRTNCQSHGLEWYLARHVVTRGLGWLKHGRRVAIRYVQRGLGFLCLVDAWSD